MPQHTPLYIVASQHPRVGKTLIARLLVEYFRLSGRPLVGYDLDPREPAFSTYFPNLAWTVDIAETPGQMALFDRLIADNWRTTVIDLGYGLFEQFFDVMAEIGFEQEARRRLIEPIVLFITDSAPATAERYAELRRRLRQTTFVPVHNEATSFMFIPQDFPPTRSECGVHPHSAPVPDRTRSRRPAGLLIRRLYGRDSRAARPKSIAGSAVFSPVPRTGAEADDRRARIRCAARRDRRSAL